MHLVYLIWLWMFRRKYDKMYTCSPCAHIGPTQGPFRCAMVIKFQNLCEWFHGHDNHAIQLNTPCCESKEYLHFHNMGTFLPSNTSKWLIISTTICDNISVFLNNYNVFLCSIASPMWPHPTPQDFDEFESTLSKVFGQ